MKLKKRTKSKRMRGHGRGTYGWGARKKHISSGNRGGVGMAGTGKTAGHRASMLAKVFGTSYLGKKGFTSRSTEHKKNKIINLNDLSRDFEKLKEKYGQKDGSLEMKKFKILGDGDIKMKVTIKASAASKSAIEKIEKAGGKVIILEIAKKFDKTKAKAEEKK